MQIQTRETRSSGVGRMVAEYRERKGMNISSFVEHSGMSHGTVSSLERGETKLLHGSTLKKVAKSIGVGITKVRETYEDSCAKVKAQEEAAREEDAHRALASPPLGMPKLDSAALTGFMSGSQTMRIPVAIRGTIILKIEEVTPLDVDED